MFFHGTSQEIAALILQTGFQDSERNGIRGVWISDRPVGEHGGETFLSVAIDRSLLPPDEECEYTLKGANYREWCVPAALLNARGTIRALPALGVDAAMLVVHSGRKGK